MQLHVPTPECAPNHKPRQAKARCTMDNNHDREPSFCQEAALLDGACRASAATAEAAIDFGCFRVLLRQRQLLRRRCCGRARHPRFRSSSGAFGGRRRACDKKRTHGPGVAGYRGVGREPQGSDLRVTQSAGRGQRHHPHGIRPRLPAYCRNSSNCRVPCASLPGTVA